MRKTVKAGVWALTVALSSAGSAGAQQLPRTNFKGVGETGAIINGSLLEQPLWRETIPQASGGQVTGDILPFDQLGLDNAAILRLLKLGAFDIGTTDLSRLAADDPRFEGCDLAGLALTIQKAREACNAYRAVLERLIEEQWNAKLLYIGVAQQQVFWCRSPLTGLADLRGRKIRVFNKTMVDFLEGIGATSVSMAFPEVVPSLQRGVIDCGVTGTLSGNTGGWGEVTTHQYPMPMGWAIRFAAINLNTWRKLDPRVQTFLTEQFKAFEDKVWMTMADASADADNCNTGKACKFGKTANLAIVPVRQQDEAEHKRLVETAVLANWARRCGDACARTWNDTVGKTLGYKAPVN